MLIESPFVKLRVIVPKTHAQDIRKVLGEYGAGVQGNYSYCTGTIEQIGRFLPNNGAQPAIGEVGEIEEVEEVIIETLCHTDRVEEVLTHVRDVHPYEEPAIDIIPRLDVA